MFPSRPELDAVVTVFFGEPAAPGDGGETLAGTITYDEACKLVARAELETAGAVWPSQAG